MGDEPQDRKTVEEVDPSADTAAGDPGSADTVAASSAADPDPAASTVGEESSVSAPDPSPAGQALRARVKAALFDGVELAPSEPKEYEAGEVLGGRYRVVGLVGRGGMGEVYRARDLVLDEDVAIKFIPHKYAHDERFMTRFVREVRLARQITHANVCRVHDIGEVDGRSFLSMEFIDGEDLASLLRRIGRLPLEKATELAQQLCAGLAALHERGVLHRDLKPHNLMVDGRGQLKITDFGLAAAADELSEHELRDGTPAYMAPEQAAGREVTVQSDLYALGLILYEVLSGERIDTRRLQSGHESSQPSPLSTRMPEVPREVDDVIAACLAPDPADRPGSAIVVAAALPGGDPVAAALAAGRTPSVDALLASGPGRKLKYGWGVAIVVTFVAALLTCALAFERTTVLGRADLPMSPDVLRFAARELVESLAPSEGLQLEYSELRYDDDLLRDPMRRDPRPEWSVMLFDYRRQGQLMIPRYSVSMRDPPYDVPGASRVTLDDRGRLRSLLVIPIPGRDAAPAVDFGPLFVAADLDVAALEPTQPTLVPEVDVDEHLAWEGRAETLAEDVRVEATALDGHVVSFDVIPAWSRRYGAPAPVPEPRTHNRGAYILVPVALLLVFGMAWRARRVRLQGIGDPRGAIRVGVVVSTVGIFGAVLEPGILVGGYALLLQKLGFLLGLGVFTYWTYLILEPFSRRYLPGVMTSWVRIVRGQFRDPLVARDVLIGVGLSLSVGAVRHLGALVDGPALVEPVPLSGIDSVFSPLSNITGAMFAAPLLFFLLAGLVRLLRRRWIASALLVVTAVGLLSLSAAVQAHGEGGVVTAAFAGLAWGLTIVRFGLLAAVSFQFVRNLMATVPITLDLSAWYADAGVVGMVVLLALLVYGARYAIAWPAPVTTGSSGRGTTRG